MGVLEAFAVFTFGVLLGSCIKGWICEARELRQARRDEGFARKGKR